MSDTVALKKLQLQFESEETQSKLFEQKKCLRCSNPFKSNKMIKNDIVCNSCSRMTDLSFWYPVLFRLKFPMPFTFIIHTHVDLEKLAYGEIPTGLDSLVARIKSAARALSLPVFLRSGMTSHKHDWKNSCFLKDLDNVESHVQNIAEFSALATIDRFMPCDYWAVRQFIKTEPHFTYFAGEMPITTERRFFIRNGSVECHHTYWPLEAFKGKTQEEIDVVVQFSAEDEEKLTEMAEYVSKIFTGYWSCDFLKGVEGEWYLTDMAIGEHSYHEEHKERS